MKNSKNINDFKKIIKKIPYLVKIKRKIQYRFFPPEYPNIADIVRMREAIVNTIVHVGAHEGQEIEEYLSLMPSKIVFIEADPTTFLILQKNIAENYRSQRSLFLLFNELISDVDGKILNFYKFNNSQSSSVFKSTDLLKNTWDGLDETGEVLSLKSTTLGKLLFGEEINITDLSILILDIQGSELNALKGLGDEIRKFKYIEVEVSAEEIYQGGPLFAEVNELLALKGFKLIGNTQWHGDAVYERIRD